MITDQELWKLNEKYLSSKDGEQRLASVLELANRVPMDKLTTVFREHQNTGWQIPVVRALARAYSIV
jgi:hypothetical protein